MAGGISFRLETQDRVVYNTSARGRELLPPRSSTAVSSLHADVQHTLRDSSLASPVPSSGGLAQLGEHYVRNVGVAGSTPVPSTKIIFA